MAISLDFFELEKIAASDIKTKGWPGLMRKIRAQGAVVVTNHHHPEAVVVEAQAYQALLAEANAGAGAGDRARSLSMLQARFDEQLASLKEGALTRVLARPARSGRVKLGDPR